MRCYVVIIAAMAFALTGCSLLHREDGNAGGQAHPAHQRAEKLQVMQSETIRDLVTGDRQFVFCSRTTCDTFTAKTVSQPAARKARSGAGGDVRPVSAAEKGQVLVQIPFEYDRSRLSEAGKSALEANMDSIKKAGSLRVVGLADSFDRDAYNLKLAKRRAETVAAFIKKVMEGEKRTRKIEVDARVVKVSADGQYPPGETFKGRRVDLSVLIVEVQ